MNDVPPAATTQFPGPAASAGTAGGLRFLLLLLALCLVLPAVTVGAFLTVITAAKPAVVAWSTGRVAAAAILLNVPALCAGLWLHRRISRHVAAGLRSCSINGLMVQAQQEGLIYVDSTQVVLSANEAAAAALGLRREELTGKRLQDCWLACGEDGRRLPDDDAPVAKALSTGTVVRNRVMCLYRSDGSKNLVAVTAVPARPDAGAAPAGAVVILLDVTGHQEAEAQALASAQRFQAMVESIADYAVYMLDPDGRVATWNDGAERIKGYREEEIVGRHFSAFYTAEQRAEGVPEKALQAAARNGSYADEGWRLRKDGSRFWASVALRPIRDGQGALQGFVKVSRDLTEQRRAALRVAEATRRLRSIVDSAPFSIITTDAGGLIDCFNPAAERLTHYARDEMLGHPWLPLHVKDELAARAEELGKALDETVEPGVAVFTTLARRGIADARDWTYVRKDGSHIPVHLAVSALHDPEDGTITGFMGIAHDVSERKRREEYAEHVAHHDFLTKLPMRSLLKDRVGMAIKRARRAHARVGLLMIDLDHFKRINDSLGHNVGDELLCCIAERLKAVVRASDTVARLGGDEFVVVLPEIEGVADAERIARQINAKIAEPIVSFSHELHVTASIGIAMFPEDGDNEHELLKCADAAMYQAKAAGRRGFRTYTPAMQKAVSDRLELENALRRALDRQELRVHYQPQVCLETGRVVGMEALARWTDPKRGPVPPAQFIPVAEESGLISRLGEWVLRTACTDARRVQQSTGVPLRLAVNLSSNQFTQSNLLVLLRDVLKDSGLHPDHLEIEITEGILMDHTELAIQRMNAIRALGISIAIDDFGTGYSSLSYVSRFPINALKIDRSFIAQVNDSPVDAAVAQAIIGLAHSLNVRVVAEGVETAEQLAFLRQRCCDAVQGNLLGKAVLPDRFSVQGYHFAEARSAVDFLNGFRQLQLSGEAELKPTMH